MRRAMLVLGIAVALAPAYCREPITLPAETDAGRASPRRSRVLHLAQAPGLDTLQLLGDGFLDDGRQVATVV